ncbi:MAG TPA: TetR family transcriptional regulator [Baekduia sp.]|nr:TetR family transcriptional regulator [Baekduia sp.]
MSDPPVRKIDRRRRERVIEGALAALYEHGVEGLTHRRVAEAADVSVGATTYYFRSLEDLLEAAMRHAAERDIAALRNRFGDPSGRTDVADVLTSYLYDAATVDRREAVIVAELFVAALRREQLREVGEAWNQAWIELLTPSLGAAAPVITVAIGGLVQRGLLVQGELSRAELREQIDLLLGTTRDCS